MSRLLKVITWPNSKLLEPTKAIHKGDAYLDVFLKDLEYTMHFHKGVGISAPQVGIPLKLFLITPEVFQDIGNTRVFINPIVELQGEETTKAKEGCLSLPEIYVEIERPKAIVVKALDENLMPFELELADFHARVVMHENDHLENRLLIDYVGRVRREMIKKKLRKLRKDKR
jgi:peptide deformylase